MWKKMLLFSVLIIVLSSFASAFSYTVRGGVDYDRVSSIMKTVDLGSYDKDIEFVNYDKYDDKKVYYGFFNYAFTYSNPKKLSTVTDYRITIFKPAYRLSDEGIKCVLKHELAHYKEMRLIGDKLFFKNMTEEYANTNGCVL
jgi:Zn-dependent protease with chaperone function